MTGSKFKVGDRVRFTSECSHHWWFGPHTSNTGGSVKTASVCGNDYQVDVDGADYPALVGDRHIELVAAVAPIRTVTRREIAYGEHELPSGGAYELSPGDDGDDWVGIDGEDYDVRGLREMAAVMTGLAEVLEENAASDRKAGTGTARTVFRADEFVVTDCNKEAA